MAPILRVEVNSESSSGSELIQSLDSSWACQLSRTGPCGESSHLALFRILLQREAGRPPPAYRPAVSARCACLSVVPEVAGVVLTDLMCDSGSRVWGAKCHAQPSKRESVMS